MFYVIHGDITQHWAEAMSEALPISFQEKGYTTEKAWKHYILENYQPVEAWV